MHAPRPLRLLGHALVLALAGCTAEAAAVESETLEGSVGVLHVERLADGLAPGDATGDTILSAAFARYRGLEAGSVVGLLGSGAAAELESCAFVGPDDGLAGSAEVELLDVGTIRVRVADTEANLVPRAFPDLASVIAGVFYAGDAQLAVPAADVDEYAFQAAGSAEVPAFDAVVPAPGEVAEVRVDGRSLAEAISLVREAGVEIVWSAGDPRDVVELEIRAGGDTLACAARDDGSFSVAPAALATLAADAGAALVVRRVRVSPVDVPGLDDAFARIAVTRAVDVDLR
jgi:hypothetical protein